MENRIHDVMYSVRLGGLMENRLIKQYSYSLESLEEKEVICLPGYVLLSIDITMNQASFLLRSDGIIYDFVSTEDSAISNTNDSASVLKVISGTPYNKVKLRNNYKSTIKVYLSIMTANR